MDMYITNAKMNQQPGNLFSPRTLIGLSSSQSPIDNHRVCILININSNCLTPRSECPDAHPYVSTYIQGRPSHPLSTYAAAWTRFFPSPPRRPSSSDELSSLFTCFELNSKLGPVRSDEQAFFRHRQFVFLVPLRVLQKCYGVNSPPPNFLAKGGI